VTSPAGARDIAQFEPPTAKQYGVTLGDNRVSDDLAGAAKLIHDSLRKTGGSYHEALSIYNSGKPDGYKRIPETIAYVHNILTDAARLRRQAGAGSTVRSQAGGQRSQAVSGDLTASAVPDVGDSAATLQMLQAALQRPQRVVSSGGLQAPAFAAAARLPTGFAGLSSAGGPQPKTSVVDALKAAQAQGQALVSSVSQPTSTSLTSQVKAATVQSTGNALVAAATKRAAQIDAQHLPYLWGGGHAGKVTDPRHTTALDCSGAVSAVLGIDPRVASQFEHFGSAGAAPGGKGITIYAKDTHVLMEINGHFFGTSASNPGGGAGWIPRSALPAGYLKGFTARHLAASV